MRDYSAKTVYVGVDVHKSSYSVTVVCEKQIVKKDKLPASPSLLANYCKKNFQGAKILSAYEAGFSGFALHRFLVDAGIENRVVHPAGIEVAVRERVKNDRRDSEKIATQLSEGRLKGIYIPDVRREGFREVSRLREASIRKRTRTSTQIKSLLHRQGLFSDLHDTRLCRSRILKLMSLEVSSDLAYCLETYCKEWLNLDDQINRISEQLSEQGKQDECEKVYRSLPGIGATSARILANELGNLSQFANEKQLFSYTGFTPREHSSGEHRWLGHISRQGKSVVRKVLVQAAWKAVKKDRGLEVRFMELSSRIGKRRAIVAIARLLIGYARSCFKEDRLYEERT